MSLLGDDFIDNCRYSHEPHGDIKITAFDFDNYDKTTFQNRKTGAEHLAPLPLCLQSDSASHEAEFFFV